MSPGSEGSDHHSQFRATNVSAQYALLTPCGRAKGPVRRAGKHFAAVPPLIRAALVFLGHSSCPRLIGGERGQIGFEGRFEYTAIGTVTNLAARLCGEANGGQVLVSERVSTMLDDRIVAERVGDLALKGFARPVSAYNLVNLRAVNDRE